MRKYLKITYNVFGDDGQAYPRQMRIALNKNVDGYYTSSISEEMLGDVIALGQKQGMNISIEE